LTGAQEDLASALAELREALDALRRAQALWIGQRPWIGAKTWDASAASRALEEAEERVGRARQALERALREIQNGAQG
jgi:hypothetical protein